MEGLGAAFVAGALAGYGVAIPVGAIAVLIVEAAVRRGFRIGASAGAGTATADGVYALIAVVAGAALASFIEPYTVPLRLVSAAVLVAIAVRGLAGLRKGGDTAARSDEGLPAPAGPNAVGMYLRFLGLTILNPMTIVYFAALVLGLPAIGSGAPDRMVFVAAAFIASLSWQMVIAGFGAVVHHRLPAGAATVTSLIGNVIVLLFAVNIALGAIRP